MTRNFLVFIFGLILLLLFTFASGFVYIYVNQVAIAGIAAIVGFVAVFAIGILIGLAAREEGGVLYVWFFGISIVTGIVLVWYLARAGTLLQIW
jgi:hypothetical protein